MTIIRRNKTNYIVFIIITLIIGLSSRKLPDFYHNFLTAYLGDVMWALMFYFLIAFLFNKLHSKKIALTTLIFTFSIELSQLYQSDWINNIRQTSLGGMALGFGFLWSDLLCYSFGTLCGYIIERIIIYKTQ